MTRQVENRMWLYRLLSGIFPNSYAAKLIVLALLALLIPAVLLLVYVYGSAAPSPAGAVAAATAGTAIAAAVVIYGLRSLMAPISALTETLTSYERNQLLPLPRGYRDEVGQVMALTDRLLSGVQDELTVSRTAADTDPLTGLLNRRGFDRHRPACDTGCLIFVDLDHFKRVNDTLGHDAGDLVLVETADLLRSVLREGELVARFGGEEFIVFLPEVTEETGLRVAERIRATAEAQLATELGTVTLSVGVAMMGPDLTFAQTLTAADRAVYAAKRNGRNQVCLYDHATALGMMDVRPEKAATAAE